MRIATVGPGTRINMTPLWFGWTSGKIYTYCRGQKVANLRRNPQATILVDQNERFPELMGAMFQGRATVLEDTAAENGGRRPGEARMKMGAKYAGGHGGPAVPRATKRPPAAGTGGGCVFQPERTVRWDNHKLAALRRSGRVQTPTSASVP